MTRASFPLLALSLALAGCDREPPTAVLTPPDPSVVAARSGRQSRDGLVVPGWNRFRCFDAPAQSMWDPDGDAMDNRCEDALAASFAPGLWVAGDCNYDPDVGRQGGEYYYAVQPVPPQGRARIAYLPAYYWDCGSPTAGPWPFGDVCPRCFADGHDGDSEFFLVDLEFNDTTGRWVTRQLFLSAHCGTPTGQYCMWYPDPTAITIVLPGVPARPFDWIDGTVRGAPIIWVAEGKHGNYSSREDCDLGGLAGSDTCNQNDRFYRFPVRLAQQNIWSRAFVREACVGASLWGSTRVARGTTECFWTRRTFYGWQGLELAGSTPYSDILEQYAGW